LLLAVEEQQFLEIQAIEAPAERIQQCKQRFLARVQHESGYLAVN
jgi:hypothetical protein